MTAAKSNTAFAAQVAVTSAHADHRLVVVCTAAAEGAKTVASEGATTVLVVEGGTTVQPAGATTVEVAAGAVIGAVAIGTAVGAATSKSGAGMPTAAAEASSMLYPLSSSLFPGGLSDALLHRWSLGDATF